MLLSFVALIVCLTNVHEKIANYFQFEDNQNLAHIYELFVNVSFSSLYIFKVFYVSNACVTLSSEVIITFIVLIIFNNNYYFDNFIFFRKKLIAQAKKTLDILYHLDAKMDNLELLDEVRLFINHYYKISNTSIPIKNFTLESRRSLDPV